MKPKYNFFKNARYALEGAIFMLKKEVAFRIEIAIIAPFVAISLFLPVDFNTHLILVAVLGVVLIAECLNSAVEACVDLVTSDFAPLAKIAKNCASAAVFFSVILAVGVWAAVIFRLFWG